ncbi:MAG: serine hydrolase domain-containing protein [Bacteroidia bacterium]|nr:serine hydrolase domain-containing protein [Bacteroidia bacterium]
MNKILISIVLLIGTLAAAGQSVSQEQLHTIDTFVQGYIDRDDYAGIYFLLAQKGQVLLSKGYGKREAGEPEAPHADTYYRMASLTKPVTTIAILKVCEEKNISLDAPIAHFLPEIRDSAITIRHLLSHTSGWGSFWNAGDYAGIYRAAEGKEYADVESFVKDYVKLPAIHAPGTAWHYGASPEVLVYWLEKVTQRKYTEFVQTEIFEPLGMNRSGYFYPNDEESAYFHQKDDTGTWQKLVRKSGIHLGSGALISTAGDYFKFCQMLANGGEANGKQIISEKMLKEMYNVVIGEKGDIIPWQPGYGFGLGVSIRVDDTQAQMGGTSGDWGWFGFLGTTFWIDPKLDMIGLIFTQCPYDEYKLNREIRNAIYDGFKP